MLIKDFLFDSKDKNISNWYRIKLFTNSKNENFVIIIETIIPPIMSVTNRIEVIRDNLIKQGHITEDYIVIECYENKYFNSFDIVMFSKPKQTINSSYHNPEWKKINITDLASLLECNESLLNDTLEDNPILYATMVAQAKEIENIYPLSKNVEPTEVYDRRKNIEKNMIGKDALKHLVTLGTTEAELQAFINKDMSLLAEVYASPDDEYMVFSQFPLGSGYVDYVLLTGRSRMDVYFIEIKGADFNIINKDGRFSAKYHDGKEQLLDRKNYVESNYHGTKEHVHNMRINRNHPCMLLGPQMVPHVDFNKDIICHYILIGGVNNGSDWDESRAKHKHSAQINYSMRYESWCSWLNKLKRK